MADGINVGDAVLTFLGDTTSIDEAFAKTDAAEARLQPANQALKDLGGNWQFAGQTAVTAGEEGLVAGEEMEEGAKRATSSLYEARGEARLLGEEFGIHLPRHVTNFIGELPGVSEALSAAFSATAILFIIQAIVELTNKVTEFVSEHFIFTEEMKASTAEVVKNNVELAKQAEAYETAKAAVEAFGKTHEEVAEEKVQKLTDSIDEQNAALRQAQDNLYGARNGMLQLSEAEIRANENTVVLANATLKALQEQLIQAQLEQVKAIAENQLRVISLHQTTGIAVLNLQEQQYKTYLAGTQDGEQKLFDVEQEYDQKRYELKRKAIIEEIAIQKQLHDVEKVAQLNAELNKLDDEHAQHYFETLQKEKEAFAKNLEEIKAEALASKPVDIDIILPETARRLLAIREAAHSAGITLRQDLVLALNQAKQAQEEYIQAGGKNQIELKQFDVAVQTAQKNLDNFGKEFDKLKLKSETTFRGLLQDLRQGIQVSHELAAAGEQAFDQMSKGFEGAIASAISGEKNFGKALEEATASALTQLAAQALVKSLFYTAEGFAALAGFAYGPAAQYFEAAGIMAAVGAAAGVAGGALSGHTGSGSSSTQQASTTVSNTTSQAGGRTATIGVQKFADGGLVSGPTLAVLGEDTAKSGPEVVAGLNDKETWQKIAKAIVPHMKGASGGGLTVNVKGMVSPDNLTKVMNQMNRRIKKGQAVLTSSNTFRITRRSA